MRADLLACALVVALAAACSSDDPDRQAEVAERGAEVMPFDLDATTHRFDPTDDGLVQTVVADDPGDAEQVELVQEHLRREADAFRAGDYGDPAEIHGHDMPGLAVLEEEADAITIDLSLLADGARLTFTTPDPTVVDALHAWAEAQVSDHGEHAE